MKNKHIREISYSDAAKVDHEAGIIRNVKILGAVSENGRRYTEGCMKSACGMYNGQHVNVDHCTEMSTEPRGVMEQVGIIKDPKMGEGGGIYADIHILMNHSATPALMERAERFPNSFGLSHDANGNVNSDGEEDVVEEITAVNSVDIVSAPATNAGLFESVKPKRSNMRTLRQVLGKAAKQNKLAKALLEAEGEDDELKKALDSEATPEMDAAAEVPPAEGEEEVVEMDPPVDDPMPGSDPVEAMRAAIGEKAMAIFSDPDTDAGTKLAALKKLLIAQDKVSVEMAAISDKVDATAESVKKLTDLMTNLVEAKGPPPVVGRKFEIQEAKDGKYKQLGEIFK